MKIAFADFWDNFNPESNFLTDAFAKLSEVEVVKPAEHPDVLIYSFMGYENLKYHDCVRLYYTGENDVPDFNLCDYAISFHHLTFGNRHLRLPLYVTYPSFELLRSRNRMAQPEDARNFCSFVVSNNWCASPMRTDLFHKLSQYKFIASGGRYANNIGGPVADKIKFLNRYKFNIAVENSSVVGYTTEKLLDALAANTVPIYWGNPFVSYDINPESFINLADFRSLDDAVEYIKLVDSDPILYQRYLDANPLKDNPYLCWETMLVDFLRPIVEQHVKMVPAYGMGAQKHEEALEKAELYDSSLLRRMLNLYKRIKQH